MTYAQVLTTDGSTACAFLLVDDKNRFGKFVEELENLYTQEEYRHPNTMTGA